MATKRKKIFCVVDTRHDEAFVCYGSKPEAERARKTLWGRKGTHIEPRVGLPASATMGLRVRARGRSSPSPRR